MAFYPLERLMNLHDGYRRAFMVDGQPLLLIHDNGRNYLIVNQCPHQQSSLGRASLSEGMLRCPLHGMRFDLASGISPDGCQQRLQYIAIAYEGNQLGIYK